MTARLTDQHLRMVAEVYQEAAAAGDPRSSAVAMTWDVTIATAENWIGKARQRGLLAKPNKTNRDVLLEMYRRGVPSNDIAKALGIRMAAVHTTIHRHASDADRELHTKSHAAWVRQVMQDVIRDSNG